MGMYITNLFLHKLGFFYFIYLFIYLFWGGGGRGVYYITTESTVGKAGCGLDCLKGRAELMNS